MSTIQLVGNSSYLHEINVFQVPVGDPSVTQNPCKIDLFHKPLSTHYSSVLEQSPLQDFQ